MKSLKHYFSSPNAASKEQVDSSKEPLHDVSENSNLKPAPGSKINTTNKSKKTDDSSEKRKKERKSISVPKVKKSKESEDDVIECSEEKKVNGAKDEEVQVNGHKPLADKIDSPSTPQVTPKPNAFQMIMSQKKYANSDSESERKKKEPRKKDKKRSEAKVNPSLEKEAVVDLLEDGDGKKNDESVGPRSRRRRQAKEKTKSFLDSDEDDVFESKAKPSGRSKKSEKSGSKDVIEDEIKVVEAEDSDDDIFKSDKKKPSRKRTRGSDEEVKPKANLPAEKPKEKKLNKKSSPEVELKKMEENKKPNALEKLMSTKKPEVDSEEEFFVSKKGNKRKRESGDETPLSSPQKTAPKVQKKSSIAGYFTPISRDEALKRAAEAFEAPKVQTVTADVHPEPPNARTRRSMGPAGRQVSSKSPKEDETIEVLDVTEEATIKQDSFETPKKKMGTMKKKRLWELRVRLLSPAKTVSEASNSGWSSTSSESDSEVELIRPAKKQISKSLGLGAGELAPIFLLRNRNVAAAVSPLVPSSKKAFQNSPMPQIRAAPTEHTIGFADEDPEAPIQTLFPPISHIGHFEEKIEQEEETKRLLSLSSCEDNKENFEPPPFHLAPVGTAKAFVNFKPFEGKIDGDGESWCEKYKPKLADAVVGNEQSVNRLRSWLERWTDNSRSSGLRVASIESESESDSMDDFIVSDDDDDSNQGKKKKKRKRAANTVLLVGPSGSGKTASVYAIAEELGFKVLEVNASSKRSGKKILLELREATQSHQVRSGAVDPDSIHSFFGKGRSQNTDSQQSSQTLSLILVEDVDIVFEDQDEGFMAALNSLAENSKRPLILISNDPNCSLVLTRQHRIHFQYERVPVSKGVDIIEDICQMEGEETDRDNMKQLVVSNKGDLRSSLLSAQFLTLSGGFPKKFTSQLNFPLNLEQVALRLQTKPFSFIISETELDDSKAEEKTKLNSTWGNDSDSDNIILKSCETKPKVSKRKPLCATKENSVDVEVEKVAVTLEEIESLSKRADCFANLDILQGQFGGHLRNNLLPGLSDQLAIESPPDLVGPQIRYELAQRMVNYFRLGSLGTEYWESNQRWLTTHSRIDKSMSEMLPINNQLDHQGVSLDYLPILRELGKCEQTSTRSSRRSSINCLQSIGMQPDLFVIEALPFVLS
ncbi:enhanced level of genomic instability 1-like isoform X2 [Neocloeon triangulifer]|uniref:enhanced level of genomic instability 1-like isoform X2 n=1 Tax=Neocloeon triangulifer TaxID=2078957 RepID=UPI00286F7B32|nr:enhanced level of genomic instability 1-like isoform X2 [Neocloeon triangulifer]